MKENDLIGCDIRKGFSYIWIFPFAITFMKNELIGIGIELTIWRFNMKVCLRVDDSF